MSGRNSNSKRDAGDHHEASSASISPFKKKKKKLDDSSADSHAVVLAVPSPSSADSAPRGCSVTSSVEEDEKSSIIFSGCFSSESNEIARNNPTVSVDLEAHEISETEASASVTSNIRKEANPGSEALGETTEMGSSSVNKSPEVSKSPTPEEIEEFLSELESKDQKRFIEKYNFDIVNDKPLPGRYKWDRLKP